MKKQRKKSIDLATLKVKSFVTDMEGEKPNTIKGRGSASVATGGCQCCVAYKLL